MHIHCVRIAVIECGWIEKRHVTTLQLEKVNHQLIKNNKRSNTNSPNVAMDVTAGTMVRSSRESPCRTLMSQESVSQLQKCWGSE
jgi:hypothetical protein